jgi:hypothetical protein
MATKHHADDRTAAATCTASGIAAVPTGDGDWMLYCAEGRYLGTTGTLPAKRIVLRGRARADARDDWEGRGVVRRRSWSGFACVRP